MKFLYENFFAILFTCTYKYNSAFHHYFSTKLKTIFEFKDEIIKRLMNVEKIADVERYVLSNEQWLEIDKLVDQKYKNWEWVYGLSPRYQYNREARLEIGTMNI